MRWVTLCTIITLGVSRGAPISGLEKYTGPFVVEKVLSPVTYLLRSSPRCRPFVSHVDKLRRCFEAEPEVGPPTAAGDPVVFPNPRPRGGKMLLHP